MNNKFKKKETINLEVNITYYLLEKPHCILFIYY